METKKAYIERQGQTVSLEYKRYNGIPTQHSTMTLMRYKGRLMCVPALCLPKENEDEYDRKLRESCIVKYLAERDCIQAIKELRLQ